MSARCIRRLLRGTWLFGLLCLGHQVSAQTVYYVHTDALGSVVAESDSAGQVVSRREYEPYGQQLTPAVQDGPGYTGHVQDAATGLTYMQQRYYDSQIGLFLSVDPVSSYAMLGRNFNRYIYANNNPYRFTDPDGRQAAERFVERHREDIEAGNGQVYDSFEKPAIAVTAAMLLGPVGLHSARLWMANPAVANSVANAVAEVGLGDAIGGASLGAGAGAAAVTAAKIESALSGSTMQASQRAVSLPIVQRNVDALLSGSPAPAIKVDGNVIVDGHHRFVAGQVVGQQPATQAATLAPSQAGQVRPIQEIKVDPIDWDR